MKEGEKSRKERIQKIISNAGFCSRRKAEELIEQGRVAVNGKVASIGESAKPDKDIIEIDGRRIWYAKRKYFAFYKPRDCLCSMKDPSDKPTIMRYLNKIPERVYPIGRLDYNAEGLLLFTNDGNFANLVMHPRYEKSKTYLVGLRKPLKPSDFSRLRGNFRLEDGPVRIEKAIRITDKMIEIRIHEGRNRIVKRIFESLRNNVDSLKRTKIGSIELGKMKPGEIRELSEKEVASFWNRSEDA